MQVGVINKEDEVIHIEQTTKTKETISESEKLLKLLQEHPTG